MNRMTLLCLALFFTFTSFSHAVVTCQKDVAYKQLELAKKSIHAAKSSSDIRQIVPHLESARLNMCETLRSCPGRKNDLEWELAYPCLQVPVYEGLTAEELHRFFSNRMLEMTSTASSILKSSYCSWKLDTDSFTTNRNVYGVSLDKCKKLAFDHARSRPWTISIKLQIVFNDDFGEETVLNY